MVYGKIAHWLTFLRTMMLSRKMLKTFALNAGRCLYSSDANVATTALNDFHRVHGTKMVNFCGTSLPVQYADMGIAQSHLHTREHASLFDVSHMLQTEITGKDSINYIERLVTANVADLPPNAATLTVFTDENGGILDDLIVTKIAPDHLYVVSNAGRKEHDQSHMQAGLAGFKNVKLRFFEPKERALVALQGPQSAEALQSLTDVDLSKLYFMNSTVGCVAGVHGCRITRCGYTGEDGFEISMPAVKSAEISTELLRHDAVRLAGLGARDSLRLEAGLCLYGSDISTQTTPVEAALTWLVDKQRRVRGDFPGAKRILQQIQDGCHVKRIGVMSMDGPPPRHDAQILDSNGRKEIGHITSGCPAPSLGKNIGMGYVSTDFSKVGTNVSLKIRGKLYPAIVTKMPFVKTNYYSMKK